MSKIVSGTFGWIFKRNPQEYDFGIDGQIEVVTEERKVSGQLLAIQIKYGSSFLKEKNDWGFVYRGESKHFNYLSNYPLPVIIAICDPTSEKVYWVHFQPQSVELTEKNWKITIPFENDLEKDRDRLLRLVPEPKDMLSELRKYWAINKIIANGEYVLFAIGKFDILCGDLSRVRAFFDRLRSTKEMAIKCQGKVELSVSGYDQDPRELFEIEEVREYFSRLPSFLPELLFFVRTKQPTHTLRMIGMCSAEIVERTVPDLESDDHYQLKVDGRILLNLMNKAADDALEICSWLKLPENRIRKMLKSAGECLQLEIEKK